MVGGIWDECPTYHMPPTTYLFQSPASAAALGHWTLAQNGC